MAKRAGGSRATRPTGDGAAPTPDARSDLDAAREETLATDAAEGISANASPGDIAETERAVEADNLAPEDDPPPDERAEYSELVQGVNLAGAIGILQDILEQLDNVDQPFTRVVGRIIFILTVDGGRGACTAGNIAATLLLILPEHLNTDHRQAGTTRQTINVNEIKLQGLLNDRLDKLRSRKWLNMVVNSTQSQGVLLSERGRFVFNGFNGWPEGIQFDPNSRDIWEKKRPTTTGRRRQRHPPAPGRANPS